MATLTPGATEIRRQTWGLVTERRMLLPSGLPVEFGVTSAEWAALPLDAGTARVLGDGACMLYDPYGVVTSALVVLQLPSATVPGQQAYPRPDSGTSVAHHGLYARTIVR